jgi:hypothetical protein
MLVQVTDVPAGYVDFAPGSDVVLQFTLAPTPAGLKAKITLCVESWVMFDKDIKSVSTEEVVSVPPRTKQTVERTVTIDHAIQIAPGWKGTAAARKSWELIAASIRAAYSRGTGQAWQKPTRVTKRVTVDRSTTPRVVLAQVKQYRTGTAIARINGQVEQIPFEIWEGFELTTRAMKQGTNN